MVKKGRYGKDLLSSPQFLRCTNLILRGYNTRSKIKELNETGDLEKFGVSLKYFDERVRFSRRLDLDIKSKLNEDKYNNILVIEELNQKNKDSKKRVAFNYSIGWEFLFNSLVEHLNKVLGLSEIFKTSKFDKRWFNIPKEHQNGFIHEMNEIITGLYLAGLLEPKCEFFKDLTIKRIWVFFIKRFGGYHYKGCILNETFSELSCYCSNYLATVDKDETFIRIAHYALPETYEPIPIDIKEVQKNARNDLEKMERIHKELE